MDSYRINWDAIAWTSLMPAVRFKAHEQEGRRLRLVEFSRGFIEPDWCRKGHIGYVLEGEAELLLAAGKVTFGPGDGVFIPAGPAHRHKLNVLSPLFRVVLVEDV